MGHKQPTPKPSDMERPTGLPTSPPPPRLPSLNIERTEMVSVRADYLRRLTSLTRELAAEVRRLEGETPSTDDCQRYVAVTIANVERSR